MYITFGAARSAEQNISTCYIVNARNKMKRVTRIYCEPENRADYIHYDAEHQVTNEVLCNVKVWATYWWKKFFINNKAGKKEK